MSREVPVMFHTKLEELRRTIEINNTSGNFEGLLSQFILGEKIRIDWKTCINEGWIEQNIETIKQGNYINLAVLGFSICLGTDSKSYKEAFLDGMKRLRSKDPFPVDRFSFVFFPTYFLGINAGVECLEGKDKDNLKNWLHDILTKRKNMNALDSVGKILFDFIDGLYFGNVQEITSRDIRRIESYGELCLLYWTVKKGATQIADPRVLFSIRKTIIENFIDSEQPRDYWILNNIYFSVKTCVLESLDPTILSFDHVSRILSNFESSLRRWPNSEKKRWPITDEYDIQSILWAILRSVFDDVVDEEPTPKFGHTWTKIDFKIPSLKTIVEAKFVRKRSDFKEIEGEIKTDSIDYLKTTDYRDIIVFIYDNSSSVEEHEITKSALKRIDGIKDVIIVSKPSHI